MKKNVRYFQFQAILILLALIASSCRKLVEIPEPSSTIVTSKVFASDDVASQAMAGIYYTMVNSREPFLTTGGMTIYTGFSSDELLLYNLTDTHFFQFYQNSLTPQNNLLPRLWKSPYSIIYQVNAVIEGLKNSTSVSDSVKKELTAEAKFVRAFINFNLVNLFGDIPIVTNTNWRENSVLSRQPVAQVYQFIIADLKDAKAALPADYSVAKGKRIVPNKWAASSLLARVYLFLEDWVNAESEANSVINSGMYKLEPVLNNVFKPNSSEAIFQLQQDNTSITLTATSEGFTLVPTSMPFAYLSNELLNAFEANDNRKTSWVNCIKVRGTDYYCPYKYKIGRLQAVPNGAYTEYYMVIRLAEQYLIRAEARVKQNKIPEAINDLNTIRQRAGLPSLSTSITREQGIDAVVQERRIELFVEWGHRWLDLKRTGKADDVLSAVKGTDWKPTAKLYPIPYSEILTAPNLKQNPGYY